MSRNKATLILTPWFPPEKPPARPGLYEVFSYILPLTFYSFWDGLSWYENGNSLERARNYYLKGIKGNNKIWRGILK